MSHYYLFLNVTHCLLTFWKVTILFSRPISHSLSLHVGDLSSAQTQMSKMSCCGCYNFMLAFFASVFFIIRNNICHLICNILTACHMWLFTASSNAPCSRDQNSHCSNCSWIINSRRAKIMDFRPDTNTYLQLLIYSDYLFSHHCKKDG